MRGVETDHGPRLPEWLSSGQPGVNQRAVCGFQTGRWRIDQLPTAPVDRLPSAQFREISSALASPTGRDLVPRGVVLPIYRFNGS